MFATSNFLVPNATFFVELVAFVLLLGIVGKWILPPINKIMEKRQSEIEESLKVIDQAKVRTEEAAAAYDQAMSKAHDQSHSVIEQATKMAEEIVADSRSKAQVEYDRLLARATSDIEALRQQAIRDLQEQVGELAMSIASRIVGSELDESRHHQLIEQAVSAVESKV
ncbi:MAG TPA: F0F1 ATP synthase subunit B [Acidimicrobiales bacterium]|nr:F0F1 ATP synthase subunit B [Acidimicrobiales bacterium]